MWVNHLLAKKSTRARYASEVISRFVESSVEPNCITVCHRSQESESDSDVYKQRRSESRKG